MKALCIAAAAALLQIATSVAQPANLVPPPPAEPVQPFERAVPSKRVRNGNFEGTGGIVGVPGATVTAPRNYQLELDIARGGKTARYKLALNGGSVNAELNDKTADLSMLPDERTIHFSASLMLLPEGGELSVSLSRSRVFKVRSGDKETLQLRSVPLTTKVTLLPGAPVTIFDDEDEQITLALTALASPAVGGEQARAQCIRNLHMIDGAKEQWALENKKRAGDVADEGAVKAFIRGGAPRCPNGGTYTYGAVDTPPTCSIAEHTTAF